MRQVGKIVTCVLLAQLAYGVLHAQRPRAGIRVGTRVLTRGEVLTICAGSTINYINEATGGTQINWRFNNGTPRTSNAFSPGSILYTTGGRDTTWQVVRLGTEADSTFIIVNVTTVKPEAAFTHAPNGQCASIPITFTNSTTGGSGLRYTWDFGDSRPGSTATNPTRTFETNPAGPLDQTFQVRLIATNNGNCSDTITRPVVVRRTPDPSIGNGDPNVTFSVLNGVPTFRRCENIPTYRFSFINETSTASQITQYRIQWGDGSPDSVFSSWPLGFGGAISRNFPRGNTTMTVRVRGADGCEGVRQYNIFVGTTPAGGFASRGNTSICAPNALSFTISETENNAPGTQYRVIVNDNTQAQVFEHPPPAEVSHTFQVTSCGQLSSNGAIIFNNAYRATLDVENPCGTTSVSVIPIYVSGRPRADFVTNTGSQVCVNTLVTLTEANVYGGTITPTGGSTSNCENTGKHVWQILTPTGATLESGNLGSFNGRQNEPFFWTGGSNSLNIRFTQPGTYRIKIFASNNLCGMDSTEREICVRPIPVSSFTLSKKITCRIDTVLITNTSPEAGCGGDEYIWDVRYLDPLNCGAGTGGFTFLNGTGINSRNPVIRFADPGQYAISLTVRPILARSCAAVVFRDTFTLRAAPIINMPNLAGICVGNTVSPTATVNSCYQPTGTQYVWAFPGGSPSSANTLNPGAIRYASQGNYQVVLQAINECGTTELARTLVVGSKPTANAGPDRNVCSGQSTTLGVAPAQGVVYTWSPATGLANPNQSTTEVQRTYTGPANDTTYRYVLRASLGSDCESTDTVDVVVRRGPTISISPNSATICAGGSATLQASGAPAWRWSPATGLNATDTAVVIARPGTTTTYTATGTLANGCSASAQAVVTVLPVPTVMAGPDTLACRNAPNVVLAGSPAGGTWSGSSFITAAGVFNPRQAPVGTYTLTYRYTAGGCNGIDSLVLTVQDPPVANAGRDTSICPGSSEIVLVGSPAGGRWSGSPAVAPNGTFSPATPGTYTLVYAIGSGSCIGTDTMVVTVVSPISNNTISSTQGICLGAVPAPLTGSTATAGGLPISYQWQRSTDSLSWQNIEGATARDLVLPASNTEYYYRRLASSSVCATGVPSNGVRVFIRPNAVAQINPAPLVGCPPFALTAAVVNLTHYPEANSTYQWFINGRSIGSGLSFPGYTIANGDDTVELKVIAINRFGCANDSAFATFRTLSSPVPAFSLSDTVGCGPLNILVQNNTPQASRYTFFWDFGTGLSSLEAQPGTQLFPVNPNRGDTIYTVRLRATGGCDTLQVTQAVRVRARPRTLFTPDKAEGCSPMTVRFNNNSAGSNARFVWDFGDGSPTRADNGLPVSHTFFTGRLDTFRVRLLGTNDCGTDTAVFGIVVNPNRVRLDFAINGDELNGCAPHTVRFINNTTGANLFRWNFGDGSPELTTNRGFDTLPHVFADTGTFSIRLFATNGCSDTATTRTVRVVQGPRVAFSAAPLAVCLGDTVFFTNSSEAGLAWQWTFGDGGTATQRQPSRRYTEAGTYRVVLRGTRQFAQGFGCTDSAVQTVVVTAPTGQLQYRGGYYCSGEQVAFTVAATNANRIVLYPGNGDSVVSTTATTLNYTYPQAGSYLPRVWITANGCRLLLPGTDSLRIERVRAGFGTAAIPACDLTVVQFTDTSSTTFGTGSRLWRFGDGTTSTLAQPRKTYTATGSYPVSLRITGRSGCIDSLPITLPVQVEASPVVTLTGDTMACVGQPASFSTVAAATSPLTYQWTLQQGLPAQGPQIQQTWAAEGLYRVQVIALNAFGCADTAARNIRVHPTPTVRAGADVQLCRGQSIQLGATGAVSYVWSPSQGLSCIDCARPEAGPLLTTQYAVRGTNQFGCSQSDTVLVTVAQPFAITVSANDTLCISRGESAQLFAGNATRYVWSPAVGLTDAGIPNPIARPASTTTYRVIGFDAYNCFTDTAFVTVATGINPTVQLPPGSLVVAGTQVQLQPTITGDPIRRYVWTPNRDLSCADCPSPTATINNDIRYRLEVTTIYGCTASDTTAYTVQCQQDQVYIPNAFSPDGDGVNDVFMVRGKGIARVKNFRVFNRFGQVVFEKSNFDPNDPRSGWDGRINGVPASPDVYVFTAEVLCTAGANFVYKGNVTLFR